MSGLARRTNKEPTDDFYKSEVKKPSTSPTGIPPTPEKLQDALWKDGKSKYSKNIINFQLTGGFDPTNYNEVATKKTLHDLAASSVFLGMELGSKAYDKATGIGQERETVTDLVDFVVDTANISSGDHQGDGFLDTGIFYPTAISLSDVKHSKVLYRKFDKKDWPTQTDITCATVNLDGVSVALCVSHMPGDGIELFPCDDPRSVDKNIVVDYKLGYKEATSLKKIDMYLNHLLMTVDPLTRIFALDTNITSYKTRGLTTEGLTTEGLTTEQILGQVTTTFNKLFGNNGNFICVVICGNYAVVKKRSPGPIDCQQGLTKGFGKNVDDRNLPGDLQPERDGMFMVVMCPAVNIDAMITAMGDKFSYYVDAVKKNIKEANLINVFDTTQFPSEANPCGFFMDHSSFFLSKEMIRTIFGGNGTVAISTGNCASFIGEPVKEFQTLKEEIDENGVPKKATTIASIEILNKYLYKLMGKMYDIPVYEMYNGFDTPHGKGAPLKEGDHTETYNKICDILAVTEPNPHTRIARMIGIMNSQVAADDVSMDTDTDTGMGSKGGNRKSKRRRNKKTQRRRRKSNRKKNRR